MSALNTWLKPEDELVEEKVAAPILGLANYKTLSNWRAAKKHPDLPFVRIGRTIRYRVGDLLEFRERHTVRGFRESATELNKSQLIVAPAVQPLPQKSVSTSSIKPTDLLRQNCKQILESESYE